MKEKMKMGVTVDATVTDRNLLYLGKFFDKKEIEGVVLVGRLNYIEVWDSKKFICLRENLLKKVEVETDAVKKERYKATFEKILIIFSNGYRKVCNYVNHSDVFICLRQEMVEKYCLYDGVKLESMGDHIRVWNKQKFALYKEQQNLKQINLDMWDRSYSRHLARVKSKQNN